MGNPRDSDDKQERRTKLNEAQKWKTFFLQSFMRIIMMHNNRDEHVHAFAWNLAVIVRFTALGETSIFLNACVNAEPGLNLDILLPILMYKREKPKRRWCKYCFHCPFFEIRVNK